MTISRERVRGLGVGVPAVCSLATDLGGGGGHAGSGRGGTSRSTGKCAARLNSRCCIAGVLVPAVGARATVAEATGQLGSRGWR